MGNGLAPMVEVALAQVKQRGNQFELTTQQIVLLDIEFQVDSQCEESGLVISGFCHAHDNLRDNHVDVFSQKIADKVFFTQSDAGSITPLQKSCFLDCGEPAWGPVGDNRLQETVSKYWVTQFDCPAALRW